MGTLIDSLSLIATLPGRKHLVAGNHDRVSDAYLAEHKVSANQLSRWWNMYCALFVDVYEAGLVAAPADWGIPNLLLAHYPWSDTVEPHKDSEGMDRRLIRDYGPKRSTYPGWKLLHGHLHADEAHPVDGAIHVGVDAWRDGPIPLDVIRTMCGAA
jgi:calcineurin-like phosphoesterase family protein